VPLAQIQDHGRRAFSLDLDFFGGAVKAGTRSGNGVGPRSQSCEYFPSGHLNLTSEPIGTAYRHRRPGWLYPFDLQRPLQPILRLALPLLSLRVLLLRLLPLLSLLRLLPLRLLPLRLLLCGLPLIRARSGPSRLPRLLRLAPAA
jgi:hypothetical protein